MPRGEGESIEGVLNAGNGKQVIGKAVEVRRCSQVRMVAVLHKRPLGEVVGALAFSEPG